MKAVHLLSILGIAAAAPLATASQSPEQIYNIEQGANGGPGVEDLGVSIDNTDLSTSNPKSIVFARLDGLPSSCPVKLAITVTGTVEANGSTDGYFDEVSLIVTGTSGTTSQVLFAGDSGPTDLNSLNPVTKTGTAQIEVVPGDTIELEYLTRNDRWNGNWNAGITSVTVVPSACNSGNCGGGGGNVANGCVELSVDLGGSANGSYSLGALNLHVETPTVDAYRPSSLELASAAFLGAEEVDREAILEVLDQAGNPWLPGQTVRQVVTPTTLFDVVVTEVDRAYEIRVYDIDRQGAKGADGLYTVTGVASETRRTWRVENPEPAGDGLYHNVQITESSGGNSRVYDFDWVPADHDWTLVRGTGEEQVRNRRIVSTVGNKTTETTEVWGIRDGLDYLADVSSETRTAYPFGEVVTRQTRGQDAKQLVTEYEYWQTGADIGRLRRISYPDGSWKYFHEYDPNGRPSRTVESYLGNPFTGTWPDADNRMVEVVRSDLASATPVSETFDSGLGGFRYEDAGHGWRHSTKDGTGHARINGKFANGPGALDAWLISPALDIRGFDKAVLSFANDQDFLGASSQPIQILVSTNYSGFGDPLDGEVTWIDISSAAFLSDGQFPETSGPWTDSGPIDLLAYADGTEVYVAFRYRQDSNSDADSSRWEIDNVVVTTAIGERVETIEILAGNTMSRSWREEEPPRDDRTSPGETLPSRVTRQIQATDVTVSDPADPGNRVTTRYFYPADVLRSAYPPGGWPNRLQRVDLPDGQIELHEYYAGADGAMEHHLWRGTPNSARDGIIHGNYTVTTENASGQQIAMEQSFIQEGSEDLLIEMWIASNPDAEGRPQTITYGDGTVITRQYGCCGLASETTRDGLTMVYHHDSLGRVTRTETWNGATMLSAVEETLDARDRVIARTLEGRDGGTIDTYEAEYLTNGDLDWERDALGRLIEHDTQRQSGGHTVRTTTLPESALIARETRTWPDGRLHRETGLAVNDTETTYGFEADPDTTGNTLETRTTTFLDASGTPTGEFRTLASRPSGLVRLEHRPAADGSGTVTARTVLDTAGRTVETEDVHGVITRFEYPDPFTSVRTLDADQDGSLGAADTATRNRRIWVSAHGTTVQRQTVEEWNEAGTWELVSQSDRETIDVDADGMEAWQLTYGAETYTLESPLSGSLRTVTTTFPDGTGSVSQLDGGRLDWTRRLDTSGGHLRTVTRSYDEFGRVGSVIDSIDGTTSWLYDDLGRITSETLPDPDPSDPADGPETRTTAYTLLANGNEQQVVTHPGTVTTTTVLDPQGRTVLRYGFGTWPEVSTYDPAGRQATLTTWQDFDTTSGTGLAGETVTRWEYNTAGLLAQKHYNDTPTTSEPGPLHAYTPGGLLLTRTLPRNGSDGQPIVVTYDYEDGETGEPHTARLIGVSYGANTPNTDDVAYTWDNRGRLDTVEDGSGTREVAYTGDRPSGETYLAGPLAGLAVSRSIHLAAGGRTEAVSAWLPQSTTAFHLVNYHYTDPYGRIDQVETHRERIAIDYRHDQNLPTMAAYAGSEGTVFQIERTYDNLLRPISVTNSAAGQTLASATRTYDVHHRVTTETTVSGDWWDFSHDNLGQVTGAVKKRPGGTAIPGYNFGYNFDTIGNRTQADRETSSDIYTRNALNQVEAITYSGDAWVLGSAAGGASVTIDGIATTRDADLFAGVLTGTNTLESFLIRGVLAGAGDGGTDAVAEQSGELWIPSGLTIRTHDESGNLTSDGRWSYEWNAENRLAAIETHPVAIAGGVAKQRFEYRYDSQGRRFRTEELQWDSGSSQFITVSTTYFLWDNWLLIAELTPDESGNLEPVRAHTWGPDIGGSLESSGGVAGLLHTRNFKKRPESAAPLYGHNGNIVGYFNLDEATLEGRIEYGPFGERIVETGNLDALPFGFSTKYTDEGTDLLYYGFRYNDPETGRWLSRDPIGEEGGLNLYGFARNEPNGRWDLLGLCCKVERFSMVIEQWKKENKEGLFSLNLTVLFTLLLEEGSKKSDCLIYQKITGFTVIHGEVFGERFPFAKTYENDFDVPEGSPSNYWWNGESWVLSDWGNWAGDRLATFNDAPGVYDLDHGSFPVQYIINFRTVVAEKGKSEGDSPTEKADLEWSVRIDYKSPDEGFHYFDL